MINEWVVDPPDGKVVYQYTDSEGHGPDTFFVDNQSVINHIKTFADKGWYTIYTLKVDYSIPHSDWVIRERTGIYS